MANSSDVMTSENRATGQVVTTIPADGPYRDTTVIYRPNAKWPWKIKRGHAEVKLTDAEVAEVISAFYKQGEDDGPHSAGSI